MSQRFKRVAKAKLEIAYNALPANVQHAHLFLVISTVSKSREME
jgi:hypothetical protein